MPDVDQPLVRICTRLGKHDLEFLTKMAQAIPDATISRDMLIRNIIHTYVNQVKEDERRRIDERKGETP